MEVQARRIDELLTKVYRSIMKVEEQMLFELSAGKLTLSEIHLLESIGRQRGTVTSITGLAQDLEITLPSVTATVQRLERKGYVHRDRSSEDARRVHVALTESGRRAEIAHRYFHRKMVSDLIREFDDEEKAAILRGLEKMNVFMQRYGAGVAGKDE